MKINQIFKKFTNNGKPLLSEECLYILQSVGYIFLFACKKWFCKFLKKKKKRINQCNCGLGGKVEYLFNLIEFYRKLKYICFFFFFFLRNPIFMFIHWQAAYSLFWYHWWMVIFAFLIFCFYSARAWYQITKIVRTMYNRTFLKALHLQ